MASLDRVDPHTLHALEGQGHGRDWGGVRPDSGSGPRNLVNARVQTASAVIHTIAVDLVTRTGMEASLEAADLARAHVPDALNLEVTEEWPRPEGVQAVAEVCIPLQVLVATQASPDERDDVVLPEMGDLEESLIGRAFDRAVEYVREIQLSYHAVTRQPLTLLTPELLPPFVPYFVRTAQQLVDGYVPAVQIHPVHMSIGHLVERHELTDAEYEVLFTVAERSEVLMDYLDLHRQGSTAFYRYGNTRECVVMMAAAGECLLNIVLAMLLWEEGLTPEAAHDYWPDGLLTRVKSCYSSRIGGTWDVTARGPVGAWSRSVAAIRHRVVHAGYSPTREEAQQSIVAVEGLLSFLGDRLVYGSNLRKYPRSASQLLGERGLMSRNRFPKWLRDLRIDPSEPLWHETFGRWYFVLIRLLGDAVSPRTSSEGNARVFAVVEALERWQWVIDDPLTRQAAYADVSLIPTLGDPVAAFLATAEVSGGSIEYPISIGVSSGGVESVRRTGPWVEEYHLLPLNGVMVDQSDFKTQTPR